MSFQSENRLAFADTAGDANVCNYAGHKLVLTVVLAAQVLMHKTIILTVYITVRPVSV